MDLLRKAIFDAFITTDTVSSREHVAISSIRHRDILLRAVGALDQFKAQSASGVSGELLAIDLRESLAAVGEITGETTPDAVLDIIFSSFCIGK